MLWDVVKLFMILVERPGDGENKKKEVIELVDNIFDDLNIDIPREMLHLILSPAIDYLSGILF
ncbi:MULTISPECIES: hypothetical protein [unclassified Thermosipho (in: thermotogales)]|uniref:hypothetical protein n=1 Tax=unclassified Thermosipho (in: thermotogales) TaxID=2676525 RepID=UPI0009849601|nr:MULTISPECIES: hypothetical protein [unclassified Thermosipho (in: thermotogales)]MBT1247323.1 hypothetical protein [Thermosipho sp. 1244]OOC46926.1 hypothetical protein XO09_03980 [Thermosipho sp. 1223]